MTIFKTLVAFSDVPDGTIYQCDTIIFEGRTWLVPSWLENKENGERKPERLILLDNLPHQSPSDSDFHMYVLNSPIPKCVFSGELPHESPFQFQIVESPEVYFPLESTEIH